MRKRVALLFGGRSLESDISIITAMQVYKALEGTSYIVEPIFMYEGSFYLGGLDDIKRFVSFKPEEHIKAFLLEGCFYTLKRGRAKRLLKPDVALVCCHGGEGENGCLQSLLDFNGIPYTCCGAMQSAICMDKAISKRLIESLGISVMPAKVIYKRELGDKNTDYDALLSELEELGYPLIVKPACCGSSIGISVASNRDELVDSINNALEFDDKAIVERLLENAVEVNCAAIGLKDRILLSETENPTSNSAFLTFEDKYIGGKMSAGEHIIPANIGELESKVKDYTLKVYKMLELKGIVRMDYLCDMQSKRVYLNEINSVPGSLAFYLFKEIRFTELMLALIDDALKRGERQNKAHRFKSNVLAAYSEGSRLCKGGKM